MGARHLAGDEDGDNPFGRALRHARGTKSVRQAAREAGISEARWRQLENGYQVVARDHRVPVRPSSKSVRAMAEAVGLDLREAFEKAGLPVPDDVLAPPQVEVDQRSVAAAREGPEPYLSRREGPDLRNVTTDALLEELAKRARANNPDAHR